jgi:PAS domain S-box-containing protein
MENYIGRRSVHPEERETAHKQLKQILCTSEEKFRLIFESVTDGIAVTDLAGNITEVNDSAVRLHGYDSKQELIGRSSTDFIAPQDHARAIENMKRTLEEGCVRNVPYLFLRKDGYKFYAELSAAVMKDARGCPQGFIAITKDISERKRMEDDLLKSEAKYRGLVEHTYAGIVSVNLEGGFTFVNRGLCEMVGYSKNEILSRPFADFIHPDDREKALKLYQQVFTSHQEMAYFEFRAIHKSGRILHMGASPTAIIYENKLVGFNSIITDITERKEAEAQLLAYQAELRSLTSQLSIAEQRERRSIAVAVHDNFGQNLALCCIKLGILIKSAPSVCFAEPLHEIHTIIKQLIEDTRSLAHTLSSPGLYMLGLGAAVKSLGEEILKPHGMQYIFEEDSQPKPLDENALTLLYQVVRELLVNITKHSQAHKVRVSIKRCKNNIHIIVEDDGVGFDVAAITSGKNGGNGFGLFSVRERLNYVSGSVKIKSERGHGTRVTLVAPLNGKLSEVRGPYEHKSPAS